MVGGSVISDVEVGALGVEVGASGVEVGASGVEVDTLGFKERKEFLSWYSLFLQRGPLYPLRQSHNAIPVCSCTLQFPPL